jgi:hypothetical protein
MWHSRPRLWLRERENASQDTAGGGCATVVIGAICLISICAGCASYTPPGRAAEFSALGVSKEQLTDSYIRTALDRHPLATLPASIAIVRVQQSEYHSNTAESFGHGNYSVVTTRDIEKPEQMERLAKLPMVRGIAPINRMLLSSDLMSDHELRSAAAELHADMLLIYTLDTTFNVQDQLLPLSIVTLGLSPNQQARVVCTASAILMDTRNGYVYGLAEATARQTQIADAWTSDAAVDATRMRTETEAFGKLVDEMGKTWTGVVQGLGPSASTSTTGFQPVSGLPFLSDHLH